MTSVIYFVIVRTTRKPTVDDPPKIAGRYTVNGTITDSDGSKGNERQNSDGTYTTTYTDGPKAGSKETVNEKGQTTQTVSKDGTTTNYNPDTGKRTSEVKNGTTTTYGPDGKTPTSKTYPDGGKINYDSNGNPVSYTSPSGGTTPLDGPPGC